MSKELSVGKPAALAGAQSQRGVTSVVRDAAATFEETSSVSASSFSGVFPGHSMRRKLGTVRLHGLFEGGLREAPAREIRSDDGGPEPIHER